MTLRFVDYSSTSALTRTYDIDSSVDISGLVDPALARESYKLADGNTAYRQFFFSDLYSTPGDVGISKIASVSAGQGWIYGYVIDVAIADEVPFDKRYKYILVGTFDEITSTLAYQQFGGYVLTNEPVKGTECIPTVVGASPGNNEEKTFNPIEYSGIECLPENGPGEWTAKPFVVSEGFDASSDSIPICPGGIGESKCMLMTATYSFPEVEADVSKKLSSAGAGIYGVENLRDFVMCGYYLNSPDAPSYLQRLLNDSYTRSDSEYGIETFVIGDYANHDNYLGLSRLDRELFNGVDGVRVRGLPGCKDQASCAADPEPVTGVFRISEDAINNYYGDLDDVACPTSGSGVCG